MLSAEDLREHLFQRIGDIAHWMGDQSSWTAADVEDVCARIHVMPFLSMSDSEFKGPNPSLFSRGEHGDWEPTVALEGITEFLETWNERADSEGKPENRIVGVVLDSAVSMAGFEMSQSEATTNFLFHINRMSRRLGLFWAIIGHTPKDVSRRGEDSAVDRLRGSAMWSTTPRTVIELRCATQADNVEEILAVHPELNRRDVLYFATAKANSTGADLRPRVLIRVPDRGAFIDVSAQFPSAFQRTEKPRGRGGDGTPPSSARENGSWGAVIDLISSITNEGAEGVTFTRSDVLEAYLKQKEHVPELEFVLPEHEAKNHKKTNSIAWFLAQLKEMQAINDKKQVLSVVDLNKARARILRLSASDEAQFREIEERALGKGAAPSGQESADLGDVMSKTGEVIAFPFPGQDQ